VILVIVPSVWACAGYSEKQPSGVPSFPRGTAQTAAGNQPARALPPDKAALIERLMAAERVDRMNARGWTNTNSTLDTAYYIKALQVRRVIEWIERGESVPQQEIDRALDNSAPQQLGGYPN
jgi:hypothetical protein